MDNPETKAVLGTRQRTNTDKTKKNATQKSKKMSNMDPIKKRR